MINGFEHKESETAVYEIGFVLVTVTGGKKPTNRI
jgi:hypothetical protein